jgi:cytoskeleton-associated protein 5
MINIRCLIHLLKESILEEQLMAQQSATHSKYTDLTMKCLWKVTKLVPGFLKDGSIRVDELLSDINGFLTDLPPPFWKRRTAEAKNSQADMPLRTIKTIMHELVNGLEENVMQYTYIFTHEPDNHVMSYLNHMLLSLKRKRGLLQERSDNVPERPVTNEMPKLQDDLEDIFSQISDKDQTKVGIQRLYDLRKQYPQIQSLIDQKLSTSGAFFQGYVRRSLANLSQEDVKAAPKPEITVPSSIFH